MLSASVMTRSNDPIAPLPASPAKTTAHTATTAGTTTTQDNSQAHLPENSDAKNSISISISTTSSATRKISARQKRLRKFGHHATSLKFSATDFVALSCGNLKQHYQLGKLIHRGRPHNTNPRYSHGNNGGGSSLLHDSTHTGSNVSIKPNARHHANVHQCLHKDTGMQRAVKVVPKCNKTHRFNQHHQQQLLREFHMLKTLDHPNLLKMYDCFEGKDHYYIIMDLCQGGDLCEELDNWGVLPEQEAARLIQQLLKCLAYCHANGVVHCNVKPEHILLEKSKAMDHIKLTDFGCAQLFTSTKDEDDDVDVDNDDDQQDNTDNNNNNDDDDNDDANVVRKHGRSDSLWSEISEISEFGPEFGGDDSGNDQDLDDDDDGRPSRSPYGVMPERQGTSDYWSPEVVLKGKTSPKRDVWAVGVLTYLLLSNQFPFGGDSQEEVCERIIRGEFYMGNNYYYDQQEGGNASGNEDDDMNYGGFGYAFSPRESGYFRRRRDSYHIYEDPLDEAFGDEGIDVVPFEWDNVSKEAKDFIRYLLTYEESKRPTAKQALNHPWIVNNTADQNAITGCSDMIDSLATMTVWDNVNKFNAKTKLKQAACTFIAAQLVLQHEREAIDKIFQALDTEHTGRLTKKQVQKGYEECFKRPLTDKEVDDLFERVDVAGTGYIEYSEFVVAAMNEKDLLQSQRIQQAFSVFDKDGDGWINREDLKDVLTHFKGQRPIASFLSTSYLEQVEENKLDIIDDEVIEKIIRQVDEDGDGKISYDDFMAMMLKTTDEEVLQQTEVESTSSTRHHGITVGSPLSSIPRPKRHGRDLSMSSACSSSSFVSTIKFTATDFIGHRSGKLTEHYEIADYIDEGGFGKVYVCRHRGTGAERAVKVVQKSRWIKNENQKVLKEFELLKSLDHPNILKMYELFEDRSSYFIVMDIYKGGDLCDELDTWGRLTEESAIVLMKSLLSCLNYIHSKKIVHRDVKPDNVLLDSSRELNKIRLIDFGLATRFEDGEEMNQRVGTSEYMAPEVVMLSYKGAKCDVWSCGVLLFLVLSDKFPFYGKNKMELYDAIVSGNFSYDENPTVWNSVSDDAKDFISQLLLFSPDNRPTAEQALAHPWLRKARMPDNVIDTRLDPDSNVERLEMEAKTISAMSALASLNSFTSGNRLQQGLQTFIASQLLLKEEKEAIDQVFQSLDITCNGKLSRQEVKAAYFSYFHQTLSDEELDDLFERIDADRSGYIEYSEFVVAALNQTVLADSKLRKAFDLFDKNGDGLVSAEDILSAKEYFMGENMRKDPDDVGLRLFLQADKDGDGSITYDEFIGMMLTSLGDGELSAE